MKTAFLILIVLNIAQFTILCFVIRTNRAERVKALTEILIANKVNEINVQRFEDWQRDNATYEARYFKMYEKAMEKFKNKK